MKGFKIELKLLLLCSRLLLTSSELLTSPSQYSIEFSCDEEEEAMRLITDSFERSLTSSILEDQENTINELNELFFIFIRKYLPQSLLFRRYNEIFSLKQRSSSSSFSSITGFNDFSSQSFYLKFILSLNEFKDIC